MLYNPLRFPGTRKPSDHLKCAGHGGSIALKSESKTLCISFAQETGFCHCFVHLPHLFLLLQFAIRNSSPDSTLNRTSRHDKTLSMNIPSHHLCVQFNLGEFVRVDVAGGTRNRNLILHTDRGRWFVRERYAGYCEPERIQFDHECARYLADRGAPVVPPRSTRDGETFWCDGNTVWEVYPFVEGRPFRDGSRDDLIALGESLAFFHKIGCDFPLQFEKAAPRGETDPDRLRSRLDDLERADPEIGEAASLYRDALIKAGVDLPFDAYSQLPYTLIHGDLQPANVLVKDGRIAAFVDLDWCGRQTRIYDIGFILLCCCGHDAPFDGADIWSLTQSPRLDCDLMRDFLRAYQTAGVPLSAEEKTALVPQVILSWCEMRIDGAHKVPKDKRGEFLSREPVQFQRLIRQTLREAVG